MSSKFSNSILSKHQIIERNASILLVLSLLVVTIGGLVEVAPLFWLENTIEKVDGMRPYTPLELAGRDIYVREGCYLCHSQMIRPFRDEVERYGHYSLAAESMYDHPFQWGSKRTGPDLARVGGRYSDEWQVQHLKDPRSVVPESVMPNYAFLADNDLDRPDMAGALTALSDVGVPYSKAQIAKANDDLMMQADADGVPAELQKRYPKAQVRDFDGNLQLRELRPELGGERPVQVHGGPLSRPAGVDVGSEDDRVARPRARLERPKRLRQSQVLECRKPLDREARIEEQPARLRNVARLRPAEAANDARADRVGVEGSDLGLGLVGQSVEDGAGGDFGDRAFDEVGHGGPFRGLAQCYSVWPIKDTNNCSTSGCCSARVISSACKASARSGSEL